MGTSAVLWENTEGQVASAHFYSGVVLTVSIETEMFHTARKLFIQEGKQFKMTSGSH